MVQDWVLPSAHWRPPSRSNLGNLGNVQLQKEWFRGSGANSFCSTSRPLKNIHCATLLVLLLLFSRQLLALHNHRVPSIPKEWEQQQDTNEGCATPTPKLMLLVGPTVQQYVLGARTNKGSILYFSTQCAQTEQQATLNLKIL